MSWSKRYEYDAHVERIASEYGVRKAIQKARARGHSDYDYDEANKYYKRKARKLYKRTRKTKDKMWFEKFFNWLFNDD